MRKGWLRNFLTKMTPKSATANATGRTMVVSIFRWIAGLGGQVKKVLGVVGPVPGYICVRIQSYPVGPKVGRRSSADVEARHVESLRRR